MATLIERWCRTRSSFSCLCLAAIVMGAPAGSGTAAARVELELVLAIDVSASVDVQEYRLQIEGIAKAFRDPEVIAAIETLSGNGVAVALVQWDEDDRASLTVPFHHIIDGRTAKAFGFLVSLAPRKARSGSTAIGSAIQFAIDLLDGSGFAGSRRVIDISGDGRSNAEPRPEALRDHAVALDITINGLAILTDDRTLAGYYASSVIGGRGAFVEVAEDYPAFTAAFRRKLLREILSPSSEAPARIMPAGRLSPTRLAGQ